MSKTSRKHRWRLLGALAAAVVVLALGAPAQADDTRGLNRDRHGGRAARVRTSTPQLVWLDGVLAQDRVGAWMLSDGTPLQSVAGLRWREEAGGRDAAPSAGRHVRLMGQWRGGVFQVRQATLISPQRVTERLAARHPTGEEKDPAEEPH